MAKWARELDSLWIQEVRAGGGNGIVVLFFFQAEDGIRDDLVTGVQTCALPISRITTTLRSLTRTPTTLTTCTDVDRKSTRLNSSHQIISYAVFCLKKKKIQEPTNNPTRSPRHALPECRALSALAERALRSRS